MQDPIFLKVTRRKFSWHPEHNLSYTRSIDLNLLQLLVDGFTKKKTNYLSVENFFVL